MGRPREFDLERARTRALEAFWQHGYGGTSLDDLTAAMGISRSSFYAAFGSKHELYLDCLGLYADVVLAELRRDLEVGVGAGELLRRSVWKVVAATGAGPRGDRRGCLLGNTAVEVAPRDPAAAARTREGLARLADLFRELIEAGATRGEIPRPRDAAGSARFLVAAVQGAIVLAKAGAGSREVEGAVEVALDAVT